MAKDAMEVAGEMIDAVIHDNDILDKEGGAK